MKRRIAAILIAISAVASPIYAQEATAEPGVELTPEPPVIVVEPNNDVFVLTGSQVLLYLVLAGLGGGGLMAIATRFLERKEVRDNAERAFESASPAQQEAILKIVGGYEVLSNRLLDFMKAVTDKQPNA
jgi:hypothetical protein